MFNWAQTFQLTKCSPILTSVCLGYMAIQEPKHPLNLNGNLTCICLPSSAEFLFKEWNWTLWGSKINVFSCKSDRDIEKKFVQSEMIFLYFIFQQAQLPINFQITHFSRINWFLWPELMNIDGPTPHFANDTFDSLRL